MDVYGDNKGIIADCTPELEGYIETVLPSPEREKEFEEELLDIVADADKYL